MPVFAYQAVDGAAQEVTGTIAADSPREARDKLRSRGLVVAAIAEQRIRSSAGWRTWRRPSRHVAQVANATRELATLLASGVGLVDALDTLAVQYKGRFQASLHALRQQVASGTSLSDAMQADSAIFDELTVQMVRVGENAGTLDVVLDQLAEFRERYLLFSAFPASVKFL